MCVTDTATSLILLKYMLSKVKQSISSCLFPPFPHLLNGSHQKKLVKRKISYIGDPPSPSVHLFYLYQSIAFIPNFGCWFVFYTNATNASTWIPINVNPQGLATFFGLHLPLLLYLGNNFVSDGHVCNTFCPVLLKLMNVWLKKLPKALRTKALTGLTSSFGLICRVGLGMFGSVGLPG